MFSLKISFFFYSFVNMISNLELSQMFLVVYPSILNQLKTHSLVINFNLSFILNVNICSGVFTDIKLSIKSN